MSSRVAIAVGFLVLVVGVLALLAPRVTPPSARPAAPQLPESLAPAAPTSAPSSDAPVTTLPGFAVVLGAGVLVLLWRARAGVRASLALGAALALVLHPAVIAAAAEPGLDLAALAIVLLGAALRARGGAVFSPLGMIVMLAGVLTARTAGPVAALAAFALIEPSPPHWSGALLVLLYGAARRFGLPGLPELIEAAAAGGADAASASLLDRLVGAASAVVARGPSARAHADAFLPGAVALAAVALLGATFIGAERRFGGPFAALLGALAVALLAVERSAPAPAAALPVVVLFGAYLSGAAEPLAGPRARAAALLLVLAIAGEAIVTVRSLAAWRAPHGPLLSAASSDVRSAASRPLSHAALRARLSSGAEPARMLARELAESGAIPRDAAEASVARDVAIAAALSGSPEDAIPVQQRVVASGFERDARSLELIDLLLRAGRPEAAESLADDLLRDARAARQRAEIRARRASATVVEAFLGGVDPLARERGLAKARALLDEAVAADPTCVRALIDRGRFRIVANDAVGAVIDLEDAARRASGIAEPHLELARLLFSRGQDAAGAERFVAAEKIAGRDDPEVRLVRVQLVLAKGDLAGALAEAGRLLPDVHRLRGGKRELADQYRRIAVAAEDRRDAQLARLACKAALDLGRDESGQSTALMLRLLRQAFDFEGMLDLLDRAQKDGVPVENARAERTQALKNAGIARIRTLDPAQRPVARERFLSALEATEDFVDLGSLPSLTRQLCEEPGGDVQRLIPPAKRAFELGVAAETARENARAFDLFQVTLALTPGNPYAYYHRGVVEQALGRADDARASFEAALKLAESTGDATVGDAAKQKLGRG